MTDPVNRPVRLAGVAGVMAVGLALTGCSGDGGEGESSSGTPSATSVSSESASSDASSSASPSSSASEAYEPATETSPAKNVPVPEMPDAAKEPTDDGLEATLEYWWDSSYYLTVTGDPDPVDNVSSEECVTCQAQVDNWLGVYGDGGWSTGYEVDLDQVVVDGSDPSNGTFTFVLTEGPGMTYGAGGDPLEDEWADKHVESIWSGFASYDEAAELWLIEEAVAQNAPTPVN
ncbi:DUF6318 family protein [Citricoccus zhacaiensis]